MGLIPSAKEMALAKESNLYSLLPPDFFEQSGWSQLDQDLNAFF
jgi:hypothetical protein